MVNAFTIFKNDAFAGSAKKDGYTQNTKGQSSKAISPNAIGTKDKGYNAKKTTVNINQGVQYNKKIFVLGRIVHLGNKAKDIHEALARPLLDSQPDLVLTHGEEMKWLRAKLPDTILGPHFEQAQALAEFLKQQVSPDDVILFKGSSRDSDFGKTGALFKKIL